MNNDTLGALMFIVFVIAFVVVMAHIGRQHYKRTRWSDHYYSGNRWDGKDEMTRAEFEKRVSEREKR